MKKTIEAGIKYILKNQNKKNSEMNAFFSGSVKGKGTALYFPANVHRIGERDIDPQNYTFKSMEEFIQCEYSVKGYIQKDQYDSNYHLMQNS